MAAEYPTAADVAASVPHFDACLEYVRALPKTPGVGGEAPLGDAHRLVLYGLFKQATVGPAADNPSAAPGMLAGPEARFKVGLWVLRRAAFAAPSAREEPLPSIAG